MLMLLGVSLTGCGIAAPLPADPAAPAALALEEDPVRITDLLVPGPATEPAVDLSPADTAKPADTADTADTAEPGGAGRTAEPGNTAVPAEPGVADAINRIGSVEVPVRRYEPAASASGTEPWATLVWAHGGSFMRGTLDWPEADWAARRFAEAGLRVYSVDYVLASDTVKEPAPANDVAAVLAWAAEQHTGPLVVGGASAGGHLAVLAALAQAERAAAGAALGDPASSDSAPTGATASATAAHDTAAGTASTAAPRAADALILQYPTLHRVQRDDAALAAAVADLPAERRFDDDRIAEMYAYYLGDGAGLADAEVAGEVAQDRLALLPPTVIVNADLDDLRASGEQFAEQLRAAGVPVTEHVTPGTVHGYLNRPEESAEAREDALAAIEVFTRGLRPILN